MHFAGWNQEGIPRLNLFFSVLISNLAFSFKDVDLMLPIVLVKGRETAGVDGEVAH
jgi:hypothetical protein